MNDPARVFVLSGVIAAVVLAIVTVYALAVEFNRQAVTRTMYVKMGNMK